MASKSTQEFLEEWGIPEEASLRHWSQEELDQIDKVSKCLRNAQLDFKPTPGSVHTVDGSPWPTQVGGDHYTKLKIQPLEYALANNLGVMEHAVVKYVSRHQDKGGKQDLEKAIDYLQKMIKHYYS